MPYTLVTAILTLGPVMFVALAKPGFCQPPAADKGTAAKKLKESELFRLSNAAVLEQAKALLGKGSETYRAELRGLATAEAQLKQARQDTAKVKFPSKLPPPKNGKGPSESAKAALAASKDKLKAFKLQLERLQAEKVALDLVSARLESSQSAAVAFTNVLDDLGAYVLELSLRLQDHTLEAVPANLTTAGLSKSKDEVQEEQKRLHERARTVRVEIDSSRQALDKAHKELLQADAENALAARKHGWELHRQDAERQFANQPPEKLLARLKELREEEDGLRGTFNLAVRRFRVREADAARLRKELDALKTPAVKVPAVSRAEDVDQAVKATQTRIEHGRQRLDRLQQLHAALDRLVEQGSICEGDAAVLEEHLFKMQVLAGALADRAAKDPKKPAFPKEFAPGPLAAAIRKLSERTSEVLGTTQAARKEAQDVLARAKEAESAVQEDQTRLATLQQTQEATRQLLQWEEKLRTLTAAKAVEVFQSTDKELQTKLAGLPKVRSAYEEALVSLGQARARLEGLKDPLFRQVEKELLADRQRIADELRKWAGLERVDKDVGGKPPRLAPEKKADASAKDSGGLAKAQQMLSTWARTAQEQDEKQQELLKAHAAVGSLLDRYADSLGEVRRLAVQQHAGAIDLKKRLGRGELEPGLVPDRVTEALKRDLLADLEGKAAGLINARTPLQEERARLEKPNADIQQARTLVKELLTSIGRRLDLSDELGRLEAETKKERERTESETKRMEQAVAGRLSGGDTLLDFFLGIDTSPGGKRLTELLQSYYRELIELEGREQSLEMQKKKIDQLIEAAQKESSQIAQTIPHLQKLTERLAGEREAQLLLVRARLRPDQADELLKAHQARTGRTLNRPPAVADKDKAALVESAAKDIFEDVVREKAARRWVAFLAERLSPAGIDMEVGRYQDKLGALFAARGTLQRRVRFLTGAGAETAKAPDDDPGPQANGGEIARVRAERTSIRRGGVLRIVIKIAVVLVLAFLLPRLANWLLVRLARRRGKATAQGDLVISLIGVFIKLAIWIAALVVILSTLGFDITAILAALGIGGLAIGLAAQDTIADVISGMLIFMERPFSINDTVILGDSEAAKVVGLTWRATRLRSPLGVHLSVPNRQVTRGAIRNLTRDGQTLDSLVFPLRAGCPIDQSLVLMEEALNGCELASREGQRGVNAQTVELANAEPFVKYTLWWHVHEIDRGNLVRAEVLGRVTMRLREAGLLTIPPSARKTESTGTGQHRQNPIAE